MSSTKRKADARPGTSPSGGKRRRAAHAASRNNGLEECVIPLTLTLAPQYATNVREGIMRRLAEKEKHFDDSVDGVVIKFTRVEFTQQHGSIICENPWVYVDVRCTASVFRPRKGMVLNGTVNRVSNSHVGIVVYDLFNASVAAQELIGDAYAFDEAAEAWTTGAGQSVAEGDRVSFVVRDVSHVDQFFSIEGGSLETLRHMVASGLGITVLPNSALYQHGYDKSTFAVRPFAAPVPSRTIALVWRDSFPRPKAIEVLRHAVPREGLAA